MIFNLINNPIYFELKKLKLISDKNLIKISSRTRDNKIGVIQDKKTKVIFLEKFIRDKNYYEKVVYDKIDKYDLILINKNSDKVVTNVNTKLIKTFKLNDDERRSKLFGKYCKNKNILDFGCGFGEFLDNIKNAKSYSAVELREQCIKLIKSKKKKINITNRIENFKNKFDLITMFHVLEHIPHQIDTLKKIHSKLHKKGKIIIEVPHAEEFMIIQDELKEYRDFVFWSEHLILHTYKSLYQVLKKSGFKKIKINYFQRYNFANNLGWFLKKKPGGHIFNKGIINKQLNYEYCKNLEKIGKTDTLIAIGEK